MDMKAVLKFEFWHTFHFLEIQSEIGRKIEASERIEKIVTDLRCISVK